MARERTQDEMRDTCDKACEILKKTRDGDDLDQSDLKLTELAVNGYLNDAGREVFEKLYRRVVIDENYVKPYLHDIEHITRDHEGYIYYKGIHIEHYDSDYVYSEAAKNELMELKRRCEFLERKGVEVSCGTAVWGWENHADEYGAERLKELNALLDNYSLRYSRVEIYNCGREHSYFVCGLTADLEEIKNHSVTKGMIGRYYDDEYEITVGNFIYKNEKGLIPAHEIKNAAEVISLLESCHGYLTKRGALEELPAEKYKTDFAAGYENQKLLDSLIDNPGRSLQYSEVFMYGYGSDQKKLYICGVPTFDEVKAYPDYAAMMDLYGDRLTVSVTSYRYGSGEPLTPDEMKPLLTVPFIETLSEAHYYLQKHDLSVETGWKDFTRDIEVRREFDETEPENEDGYEQ